MKLFKTALLITAAILSITTSYATLGMGREIDVGYYTDGIKGHPIDFSKYHPDSGFMLSMQKTSTELTPYASLDWGLGFARYHAGNQSMESFSMFPALRLWLYRNAMVRPFAEMSVGAAYNTQSHFAGSDLGSRFSLQSSVAIGLNVGELHVFSFMLKYLHYSNYGMFKHNQGMDVPIMLVIGYQL